MDPVSISVNKRISPETSDIIFHYGIEIECVFDIINKLNTFIFFLEIYFNKDELNNSIENFETYYLAFNLSIKKLFEFLRSIEDNISDNDDITRNLYELKQQLMYKELLLVFNKNESFYEYFKPQYIKLSDLLKVSSAKVSSAKVSSAKVSSSSHSKRSVRSSSRIASMRSSQSSDKFSELSKFIEDSTNFIKGVVNIIVLYINTADTVEQDFKESILEILDLIVFNKDFKDLKNRIRFGDDINLFDTEDTETELFYRDSNKDDSKLYLLYTQDTSVVCEDKKVYKNIASKILSSYKILFDQCEFITQVFKSPDDIKRKLDLFFSNQNIIDTLLNCEKTSNHVHISFNTTEYVTTVIKPDIKIIIALLCICFKFQDNIFKLFLNIRSDNKYCMKLNFHQDKGTTITLKDNYEDHEYDKCIEALCDFFYNDSKHSNIKLNRYFWLNIINLYKIQNIRTRPPTVEFRIKHGSTDTEEMKNVCILYTNILKYAITLSTHIKNSDTSLLLISQKLFEIIDRDKQSIYDDNILGETKKYFTDSEYSRGLEALNTQLGGIPPLNSFLKKNQPQMIEDIEDIEEDIEDTQVGDKHKLEIEKFFERKILELKNKSIFKLNSFGKQFIGYGLNDDLKEGLNKYLNKKFQHPNKDKIFSNYLKVYGLSLTE